MAHTSVLPPSGGPRGQRPRRAGARGGSRDPAGGRALRGARRLALAALVALDGYLTGQPIDALTARARPHPRAPSGSSTGSRRPASSSAGRGLGRRARGAARADSRRPPHRSPRPGRPRGRARGGTVRAQRRGARHAGGAPGPPAAPAWSRAARTRGGSPPVRPRRLRAAGQPLPRHPGGGRRRHAGALASAPYPARIGSPTPDRAGVEDVGAQAAAMDERAQQRPRRRSRRRPCTARTGACRGSARRRR